MVPIAGESDQLTPALAAPMTPAWKGMDCPALNIAEVGKTKTVPPPDAGPPFAPSSVTVAVA